MTDLHDRFETWLAEATPGDPPRDLALHASGCDECVARAAAVDALRAIDPGLAPDPPLLAAEAPRPAGLPSMARAGAGFAAVALLGAAVLIGNGALLADRSPATGGGPTPAASVGEGVLGAAGGPSQASEGATGPPTPTAEAEASPEAESPSPSDTIAPVVPGPTTSVTTPGSTPRPVTPPPPPTPTPAPPTPTPTPTVAPTATPSPTPPTASPTPTPSPTASPTPTPSPTASPTPISTDGESAGATSCTNDVDDDGDLLVDEWDLGCQLGTRESDL